MLNAKYSLLLCLLLAAIISGCAHKQSLPPQQPGYVDAVELKLKCRELADQMLATVPNEALKGFVAMPTSFVNENNMSQSSPLGRLIAESMYYEFNQRGFPTREYRLTGKIVESGNNDLALASNSVVSTKGQKWAALLVGTYCVDKDGIFINARLVRASDGLVLRTGQLVLPNTPVIMRLAAGDTVSRPAIASGSATVRPVSVAPLASPYCSTPSGISGSIQIVQGK